MLTPEEQEDLKRLIEQGISIRAIARRPGKASLLVGRDPKTIRRTLGRRRPTPPPPKLTPFQDLARDLFSKGARSPRILREIRARGYTGGLTILKEYLRTLAPPRTPKQPFRRFETRAGLEAQSDWSPYRVSIAGVETVIHAFALILCSSRRYFVMCFRNERLATLLWAHQEAFAYHGGVTSRILYDNQTAVTLGRLHGKPLWNPTFLDFAKAYGFAPVVGRPRKKERRGKVERPFRYFEEDFLPARTFASWDDLHRQVREWLDTVANVRTHGTTHRRIDEAYAEEKPCLIALPAMRFPAERRETRTVQKDGYVPVDGSFYPVPNARHGQTVTVRIFPNRVEVLDGKGEASAAYTVPDRPTRIPAPDPPPTGKASLLVGVAMETSRSVLEARFLARFPRAAAFLDGLKRRMTALTPIHLKAVERLVGLYGDDACARAIDRAATYRNFNARAIERILERACPTVVPEPALDALSVHPEAMGALDDIDPSSPEDYTLDSIDPHGGPDHGA